MRRYYFWRWGEWRRAREATDATSVSMMRCFFHRESDHATQYSDGGKA